MRQNKILFSRVFVCVYLFFIVLMLAFGYLVYQLTAKTVRQQLASTCAGIATATATMLQQDAAGYAEFTRTLDITTPYYKRVKKSMEQIREGNRDIIAFLYTERKVGEGKMMFILDGEPEGAPYFSPPGEIDAITETRRRAYDSQATVQGVFVTTKYGTLLSAYAPIVDPDTETFLGLVGVDVSIDHYLEIMHYQMGLLVGAIVIMCLMTALALALSSSRIERLLVVDSLTEAYNKSFFLRSIRRQARLAKKRDEPLLVIMADIDDFKGINDVYGLQFGDRVLIAVSKAIKSVLRESDVLARYGGEEFSAYFPGLQKTNAQIVLERIRQAVEEAEIYNFEYNKNVRITISIGAAFLGMNQTIAEVIEDADKALNEAKKTRNTVTFFSPRLLLGRW